MSEADKLKQDRYDKQVASMLDALRKKGQGILVTRKAAYIIGIAKDERGKVFSRKIVL